jgi:hypothetical protein
MSFEFLVLSFEFWTVIRSSLNGFSTQNSKLKTQDFFLTERELHAPPAFGEWPRW